MLSTAPAPAGHLILNQPVYHQSEIHTFLKCGRMWEFRYIHGIKLPARGAMTLGLAVDGAVSLNLSQKIHTDEDVPLEQALDWYSDEFEARRARTEWQEDEDPDKLKDVGAALVELHHHEIAPSIDPESVQERFLIRTDAGYDLGGTIDLVEKSGVIADTKTSRTAYGEEDTLKSIQATLYDFAYEALRGRKSSGFRFDVLIKTKVPRAQQVHASVGQDDRNWLFETVAQVDRGIRAGVALPAPEGSWYCSPKWCGYWSICKGRGNAKNS